MLSSALLYSVMDHALSYHTHHTRHGCQKRREWWALAGALPASLWFPVCEHPKNTFWCNLILSLDLEGLPSSSPAEADVCSLHCPIPKSQILPCSSPHPVRSHPAASAASWVHQEESCLLSLTNLLLVLPMKWWQKHLSFLSEHCLVLSEHKWKEGKGNFLMSCGRDKQNLAFRPWIWLMSC